MKDPYELLSVSRAATTEEITAAFRRLAYLHPDQHPNDPSAPQRFAEIAIAYHTLKDPDERAKYDAGIVNIAGFDVTPAQKFGLDLAQRLAPVAMACVLDPAAARTKLAASISAKASTLEGRQEIQSVLDRVWQIFVPK